MFASMYTCRIPTLCTYHRISTLFLYIFFILSIKILAHTSFCSRRIEWMHFSFDPELNKPLDRCSAHQREEEKQSMFLAGMMWYLVHQVWVLGYINTLRKVVYRGYTPVSLHCFFDNVIDPPNWMIY